VTLFTALVAPAERQLRYVSAGHPATLLWNDAGERWLESTGPIISPVLPGSWEVRTTAVNEGDQLLLYTDGVSDPLAGADSCAEDRIRSLTRQHTGGGLELLDGIIGALRGTGAGQQQSDDFTLLTARVLGA
jgi:sigma-B regulation protein RsbU (phosphoserine phosphatase)